MVEIENDVLVQKRKVLLKTILIKHCMEVYEIKKNAFYQWHNLSTWTLSAKIRLLEYRRELIADTVNPFGIIWILILFRIN